MTVQDQSRVVATRKAGGRGIGVRIARIRKERGFRSMEAFAAHLRSSNVTLSVLRNIESGRLADLRISQLFEIANGLQVSPLVLLFDLADPFSTTDLAGLPPALAQRTHEELEYWTTLHADNPLFDEVPERLARDEGLLLLLRRLRNIAARVGRLQFYVDIRRISNRANATSKPYSTVQLRRARSTQERLTQAMREEGIEVPMELEWAGRRLSA